MSQNPFDRIKKTLEVDGKTYQYYALPDLKDPRVGTAFFPLSGSPDLRLHFFCRYRWQDDHPPCYFARFPNV
jgi:hypothetical protein